MSEISETARVRLLGGGAEKSSAPLPVKPVAVEPPPRSDAADAPPAPAISEPIFLSETAEGADVLDAAAVLQPLAQLCVTRRVQTPFLAAVAGPAGAGKTFALRRLAQTIEASSNVAGALSRIVVAEVDAADGAAAPVAIASAAYAALDREPGSVDYSALLDESAHAGGDPLRAAKAASDRHDEVVRRLEAERSQRDEVETRRARLADALLFETPGSRVDGFVRARRGAIEARLRRFDLGGSDAGVAYREFVRDMASMGAGSRAGIALRSIWAYGSQRRLLFWAIVAFLLGFGVKLLDGAQTVGSIESLPGPSTTVASWIQAHASWFDNASRILYLLGALALLLNLWRAVGFSSVLLRGTRLLNSDLRDRGRDLDARADRLNQRVAALTAEAEAAAKHAEAAARRAGSKASMRGPGPDFLEANQGPPAAARAFLAELSERMGGPSSTDAPDRLVFLIDNIDALPPAQAIGWLDAAQSVIGPGAVGVVALDPARLVDSLGGPREARRRFDKWLQVVVNLPGRGGLDGERLVARLLAGDGLAGPAAVDSKVSAALVEPLTSAETALLSALAPLAAHSPRGAKRFLNAYRLARCSSVPRPVMALMQAVAFADDDARAAIQNRLTGGSGDLGDIDGPSALVNAVKSAREANKGAIALADARTAADVARRYALLL